MFNAHADCVHDYTKAERDKCTKARRRAESMARHPSAGTGAPWVTEEDAASVGAALPELEPVLIDTKKVTTIKVNPKIWNEAMSLAGGNRSRIVVLSPTQVEVRSL